MTKTGSPFHLVLIIHAHQPAGNFEHVFEECFQHSYDAFLSLVEKHPGIRLAIHYSGPLLLWIEKHHPSYFDRLRALVGSGQVELIGGGFYEPILISIPEADRYEQITRLADYIEKHFGKRPNGLWLTERVWEPQLPSSLAAANVGYTLVDDLPFLTAGFDPEELFGPYIAEDCGKSVWLFPGLKELRYLIPFRLVEESIAYFKNAAQAHPGGVAAFGDDMEKFGVWPGTFEHCYKDGWLEKFFTALDDNAGWLKTITPSECIASHTPLGRADLPTASYAEMMEWVLPTSTRLRFYALHKEFASRPDLLPFLRGSGWRGFLRKYPESNLLHKKMLRVSACVASVPQRRSSPEHNASLLEARDLMLRGQGNDAYWHGVFGGLYAPHLRTELWRKLVRAETLVDQLTPGGQIPRVEFLDYDADGNSELLFTAPEYQALLKPSDGATLAAVDFRPCAATLINSVQRRPEAYHSRLREAASAGPSAASAVSIHDQVRVKEPNLERFLRYDRFPRHSFRLLLFDQSRTADDYAALQLNELVPPAAGNYEIRHSSANYADLVLEQELPEFTTDPTNPPRLTITKHFLFGPAPQGCELSCDISLTTSAPLARPLRLGIESVINFLAPTEPDRFFETPAGPRNLRFTGTLPRPVLRLEDGWQRIRATLHAPASEEFWIAPIETVSESEGGFERVYQGSQILAVWKPDLTKATSFSARLMWRVEAF
ncbi:MAG TPA: alpha-amylase/4-alpha-glucanotransferase domain-containing protein [Candidatus Limnocylindrales bacterium]|nr:alpha-amylase/4-alpha-glucanotransferase domain-containing protein [Candidatus Limnocylindrales bacterium]